MEDQFTLRYILGDDRMQALSQVARHSSLYGVMVNNMESDELLAVIGYLVESLEHANEKLFTLNKRLVGHSNTEGPSCDSA